MKKSIGAILGMMIIAAQPVLAEGEHTHAGKHGGKVVESGHHHIEVVAKDGVLELFVEGDDGKSEDVKDAKAKATVLSEGKKAEITLAPDPANSLKGTGSFKASKGTVIVVTLTMPGHDPEQARIKLD